jgi:pyruvate/2-oxoglutarate dehydrogenase complex dihydrolipoamide dehydrogenase (E3) component
MLQGHARFETPHRMIVGYQRIEGKRIFLNVGGRAAGRICRACMMCRI